MCLDRIEKVSVDIVEAWRELPVPPPEDLWPLFWPRSKGAEDTFRGIPPTAVDIESPGFLASDPLLHLPPPAAAAYLCPYLLSLLEGLKFQKQTGFSYDILTRAHLIACLFQPMFWERIIYPHLTARCRAALLETILIMKENQSELSLEDDEIALMMSRAAAAPEQSN